MLSAAPRQSLEGRELPSMPSLADAPTFSGFVGSQMFEQLVERVEAADENGRQGGPAVTSADPPDPGGARRSRRKCPARLTRRLSGVSGSGGHFSGLRWPLEIVARTRMR